MNGSGIRSIPAPSKDAATLGMMQSFMDVDHRVPEGARVLEAKSCENCTRTFFRPKPLAFRRVVVSNALDPKYDYAEPKTDSVIYVDTGKRYCNACVRTTMSPVDDQEYREQLPKEAEMRHSHHLPKYDESVAEFPKRKTPVMSSRSIRRYAGNWLNQLLVAVEKQPMTREEIAALTGVKYNTISSLLAHYGFSLVIRGNVWPRKSCMGVNPKLFTLEVRVRP